MIAELLVATKSRHADEKTTVSGLSDWFSSLPVPSSRLSDTLVSAQVWLYSETKQMSQ